MFTPREEAEIVKIALEAELCSYQNNFIEQIEVFTERKTRKLLELLQWLKSKRNVRALIGLYLEMILFSSCLINPAYVHELERI